LGTAVAWRGLVEVLGGTLSSRLSTVDGVTHSWRAFSPGTACEVWLERGLPPSSK